MKKKNSNFRSIDFKIYGFIFKDTDKYLIFKPKKNSSNEELFVYKLYSI